jgi:hypothetical protein
MNIESLWAMLRLAIGPAMSLILLLIGLDLVLGILCAIKRGAFEWGKVGQFYQTMVIPYVGGYLALQIAFTLLPEQLATVLSPMLTGVALATILTALAASILSHIREIGFVAPSRPLLL